MSINDPDSKKIKLLDVDQATSGANGTYIALLGLRDNVYLRYICTHSADMHRSVSHPLLYGAFKHCSICVEPGKGKPG